jgi:hypothetical protein
MGTEEPLEAGTFRIDPQALESVVTHAQAGGRLGLAVRPRNGGECSGTGSIQPTGDDLGEATYAVMIQPGEGILLGAGKRFRLLDVVPFEDEDESPFVGLLQVEAGD